MKMTLTADEKTMLADASLPDIEFDAKDPSGTVLKTTASGVVLVPQPSDDPEDPLVRITRCDCRLLLLTTL